MRKLEWEDNQGHDTSGSALILKLQVCFECFEYFFERLVAMFSFGMVSYNYKQIIYLF